MLILHTSLLIAIWHVTDFHLKDRSMGESLPHGRIRIFDIQIVSRGHRLITSRGFADHHSECAKFDLDVLNQTVGSHSPAGFSPTKPLD